MLGRAETASDGHLGTRRGGDCRVEKSHDTEQGAAPPKSSEEFRSFIWPLGFTGICSHPRLYPSLTVWFTDTAAIGMWPWNNPSKFGTPIPRDLSLTNVGGTVPFSS